MPINTPIRSFILTVSLLATAQVCLGQEPPELNFGVIIQTMDSPAAQPTGLGFDGTHLWLVTDAAVRTIWKLDPEDGAVVESFAAPVGTAARGLDHNGSVLLGATADPDRIYLADPADGTMLTEFVSPFDEPNGVVWDGADIWHSAAGDDLHLIDDQTGATIRTIPAPGLGLPRGMAWDGTTLWVSDADGAGAGAIYQLDPIDGTVRIAFVPVGDPLSYVHAVTYDGKYLWIADNIDNQLHKVELGLHIGLWIAGSCPGATEVRIGGETPDGRYALIRGNATGSFEIPAGACENAILGLQDPELLGVLTADATGEIVVDANFSGGACGSYLQVLDLSTCWLSGVGRLPLQ